VQVACSRHHSTTQPRPPAPRSILVYAAARGVAGARGCDVSAGTGTGSARARETGCRRPPPAARLSSQCQARFAVVVGSCRCRRRLSASTIYATSSNAPTVDRRCLLCAVVDSSASCCCSSCSCPHPARACRACRACPHAAAPQLHPHRPCAVHLAALLLTGLAAPPAAPAAPSSLAAHRTAPHYSCRATSTGLAASPLPAYMR
jgi:hypothetical protein